MFSINNMFIWTTEDLVVATKSDFSGVKTGCLRSGKILKTMENMENMEKSGKNGEILLKSGKSLIREV